VGTVGAGAGPDIEHHDRVLAVVDLVQHTPVPTESGTVDSSELVIQGLTDPLRIFEQRAGDELNGSRGNFVREPIGEGPTSWG